LNVIVIQSLVSCAGCSPLYALMHRSRLLHCFLALLAPFASVAADVIPISAPFCTIELPPEDSGENATHAVLLKVFPRKATVASDYTGCQTMWVQNGSGWDKFSIMFFVKGRLQTWWAADDANANGTYCQFTDGKLLPQQPKACYEPSNTGLQRSYAPGCVRESIQQSLSKQCFASLED
jgi:hypothetical protein